MSADAAGQKPQRVPPLLASLDCVKIQLNDLIDEAERMLGLEFPYSHSREALQIIVDQCKIQRAYLERLDKKSSHAKTIEAACSSTSDYVVDTLDVLGFILRSTNTRNAFELYGPLLRLAQDYIGKSARLLLSSEWSFNLFLLQSKQHFPSEFVLIGQPATESSNPFIVPLAAHELGHSVWHIHRVLDSFVIAINTDVTTQIEADWSAFKSAFNLTCAKSEIQTDLAGGRQIWIKAVEWCQRQIEELFCDLFGLKIFGTAYLHAFAYLLSPRRNNARSHLYPPLHERAQFHIDAAKGFGYLVPQGYQNAFGSSSSTPSVQDRHKMILAVADTVRKTHAPSLIQKVNEIAAKCRHIDPTPDATNECVKAFHYLMPAQSAKTMADIANAAWIALLSDKPFCAEHLNEDKAKNLVEIALKSFEIFETECCLRDFEAAKAAVPPQTP